MVVFRWFLIGFDQLIHISPYMLYIWWNLGDLGIWLALVLVIGVFTSILVDFRVFTRFLTKHFPSKLRLRLKGVG